MSLYQRLTLSCLTKTRYNKQRQNRPSCGTATQPLIGGLAQTTHAIKTPSSLTCLPDSRFSAQVFRALAGRLSWQWLCPQGLPGRQHQPTSCRDAGCWRCGDHSIGNEGNTACAAQSRLKAIYVVSAALKSASPCSLTICKLRLSRAAAARFLPDRNCLDGRFQSFAYPA